MVSEKNTPAAKLFSRHLPHVTCHFCYHQFFFLKYQYVNAVESAITQAAIR